MSKRRYHTFRDYPVGKDDKGRPLCRWCKSVVYPPRRTFCSQDCVRELSIRTSPNYLRDQVLKRDEGVCASCGVDTLLQRHILSALWRSDKEAYQFLINHWGVPKHRAFCDDLWDADHIVELNEDGEHSLDNLQTLCCRCHAAKTARYNKQRAERRKWMRRPVPLDA